MTSFDSKDPWSTGDRAGYTPPSPPRRNAAKKTFDFGRLLRTVLAVAALLWVLNYAWQHYYLPGR